MRLFKIFVPNLTKFSVFVTALLVFSFQYSHSAQAKDLNGRLGVGFNNEYSNSTWSKPVPALSVKYGMTKGFHVQADLGFNTGTPSAFTLGGKFYRNIFYETNFNFYGAAAVAYVKAGEGGVEVLGLLGGEFFIPGVDSLGFLFEAGVSGTNITGSFLLKTVGFTFINAGMHFYF